MANDRSGLDEDRFKAEIKSWKKKTGDKSKLKFEFVTKTIQKQTQLYKAPKLLCVHLQRVQYSEFGT